MTGGTEAFTSFRQAEAFLDGFTNYEKIGLPVLRRADRIRMQALLDRLGNPQHAAGAIHVTGSKGKGTTCLVLEALLGGAGLRVGTYLSPHVECITERIRVGGRQLSRRRFAEAVGRIRDSVAALGHENKPSYFEVLTALAWSVFREDRVDVAVIEAGIGARHDATSILDPRVTVVTSIEREHTQVLGRTEAEILGEKLGLACAGVPLLVGPLKPNLRPLVAEEMRRRGAEATMWNGAIRFRYKAPLARAELLPPLPGHAVEFLAPNRPFAVNATIAIAASTLYLGEMPPHPAAAAESCRIPGRQEFFAGEPPVLLDVAHTFQSLKALKRAAAAAFPRAPITCIFALASTKDPARLLPVVESFASSLILVRADPFRGWSAEELARGVRTRPAAIASDTADALNRAFAAAGPAGAVCVCGSFVLAGQARGLLRKAQRGASPWPDSCLPPQRKGAKGR